MIQITDLSFSFGKTRVLENLNLTVPDGCIMGLVGINGAGKSTLFRLLTSIYTAESGSISYDGIPPQDEHLRKKVYFLPDDPYFSLHTTMKSMLEICKCMYDVDMEKYNRLKSEFGLDEKKPLRSFSKGMRRQAATILALSACPDYLLLDETFDGLDPVMRGCIKQIVYDDMAKRG
ncbi:MAG: ATP-binding cassette domain-containing protein, partial [Clostridia bacterium]|nr:ATP-binding cassette domain-containing protein [Clostridia bacterium]